MCSVITFTPQHNDQGRNLGQQEQICLTSSGRKPRYWFKNFNDFTSGLGCGIMLTPRIEDWGCTSAKLDELMGYYDTLIQRSLRESKTSDLSKVTLKSLLVVLYLQGVTQKAIFFHLFVSIVSQFLWSM